MRSTTTSSEETRLHPLTLAFASADLERRFWSERNRKTIGASRLTLVLGVGIYAVFGLLDRSVMLDIDHFKQINDTHGHAAGDRVLQVVASTLRRQLRPGDFRVSLRRGGVPPCTAPSALAATSSSGRREPFAILSPRGGHGYGSGSLHRQ